VLGNPGAACFLEFMELGTSDDENVLEGVDLHVQQVLDDGPGAGVDGLRVGYKNLGVQLK
jgi:hypothetical protein